VQPVLRAGIPHGPMQRFKYLKPWHQMRSAHGDGAAAIIHSLQNEINSGSICSS